MGFTVQWQKTKISQIQVIGVLQGGREGGGRERMEINEGQKNVVQKTKNELQLFSLHTHA